MKFVQDEGPTSQYPPEKKPKPKQTFDPAERTVSLDDFWDTLDFVDKEVEAKFDEDTRRQLAGFKCMATRGDPPRAPRRPRSASDRAAASRCVEMESVMRL